MLARNLRKLATPIVAKRASSVAAEGGVMYDAVLVAAWTGLLYNHYSRQMNLSMLTAVPLLYPLGGATTEFDYSGIKKVNNLFGQFQPPPPFSY